MSVLPIGEAGMSPWRSTVPGVADLCGHDGHTAMLLGATRWPSDHPPDRTLMVLFQPAEELEGGAERVIADGLFTRFGPVGAVFGPHNRPSVPLGRIEVGAGPPLAAADRFEVRLTGRGSHASAPHLGADAGLAVVAVAQALATVGARDHDPLRPLVLSVTHRSADGGWNAVPERAVLRGTVRAFEGTLRVMAERRVREVATGGAAMHGCAAEVAYERGDPPLHNPAFDFNDDALSLGAALLTGLAPISD